VLTRCQVGLLPVPRNAGTGAPPQWAVPGYYFSIGSRFNWEYKAWKVVDIYDDGTTLYIVTDQTGGFPTPTSPSTGVNVRACPVLATFSNCSGCDDAVAWSAVLPNKRLCTQWKMTYDKSIGHDPTNHLVKMAGKFVSVKVTISSGFTGGTFDLDDPFVADHNVNSQVVWSPHFDLTTPGVRLITPGGANPALGSDSGLLPPSSGDVYFAPDQITPSFRSATGSGTVTLEIQGDLGANPPSGIMPVRFRLH
jgi:hypothetical protein